MIEYTDDSLMPWGKHKGKRMGDLTREYFKYIHNKFNWGWARPRGEESAAVCRYIYEKGYHKS